MDALEVQDADTYEVTFYTRGLASSEIAKQKFYAQVEALADGRFHDDVGIGRVGCRSYFMACAGRLPWLSIERDRDCRKRFVIDSYLRDICAGLVARPALGLSIPQIVADIDHRRHANREKQDTLKWTPEKVRFSEQVELLDWVEAELQKFVIEPAPTALAPPTEHFQKIAVFASESGKQKFYAQVEALADGRFHDDVGIGRVVGRRPDFMACAGRLPWLSIERDRDFRKRFLVDFHLRAICELREPRPALGGLSIQHVLANLVSEIQRQRTAWIEEQKGLTWNPEKGRIVQHKRLLDWVETELQKLL